MKQHKQLIYVLSSFLFIILVWSWLSNKQTQNNLVTNQYPPIQDKPNLPKHKLLQTEPSITTPYSSSNALKTQLTSSQQNDEQQNKHITALIQKRLSPQMIREINEKLNPPNRNYTEVKTDYGAYVNLRGRASSVSIALIDDNGELIVTDITSPIPLNTAKQP